MKLKSTILASLFLLSGCQSANDQRLEMALEFAGDNRVELEKVLEYYSHDEADSLKLEAAKFLIRNMPGHRSYVGEAIEQYYAEAAPILLSKKKREEKETLLNELFKKYPEEKIEKAQDIHIMKGDYLIKNIEAAFRDWEEGLWAKDVSFDDFCEYMLPYKCIDYQALDGWRDSLRFVGEETIKFYPYNYVCGNSSYWAARTVNRGLGAIMGVKIRDVIKGYSLFRVPFWTKIPSGSCGTYSTVAVAAFRSRGIPAVNDFILHWASGYSDHSWVTFLMESGNKGYCEGSHRGVLGQMRPGECKGKVYRRTYAANDELVALNQEAEHVPSGFRTWFMKDVTEEYVKPVSFTVRPADRLRKAGEKYAYVAVYGDSDWFPIGFKKVEGKTVTFDRLEKGAVYLPCYYTGDGVEPMNYPVWVDEKERVHELIPDTMRRRSITIQRKYPIARTAYDKGLMLQGGSFQSANRPDFSDAVTHYTFSTFTLLGSVALTDTAGYRYWRYYSPGKTHGNIAEIGFFTREGRPVKGEVICTAEKEPDNVMRNKQAPFDNEPFSYFNSSQAEGAWIGMDFSHPVALGKINYVARNDDNNIRLGDVYELYYWDLDGWVSLGQQQADDLSLTFDRVPENALLILRDHTRGKDERIFMYEDGRQVWY